MKKFKEKGFTLIELIAVLVIMAILALIVTPLVMNIIRKAKTAADKRSIDAYGRSIEIAIAGYLLDTGTFPTSMDQLTVEYKGDEVVCSTTQIKSDSSVYLAGCTVGGREVKDYTYGSEEAAPTYTAYKVGDEVKYNNVDYYVIKDSDALEDTVTLLKAEPLSYEEITTYSAGTGAQTYDINGYGGMQYGTTSDYSTSYVKQALDVWKSSKASAASESRLIQYDEIVDSLGYEWGTVDPSNNGWVPSIKTPSWMYNVNCDYWTMTSYQDEILYIWYIKQNGFLDRREVAGYPSKYTAVRPVITISKSVL